MVDPAVLGTVIIGLEAIRRDDERPAFPGPSGVRATGRSRRVRRWVAAMLRRSAEVIEPTPAGAAS